MLQALLHVGVLSLTLYAGPSTPTLRNVAASIELPESGFVLEVADSLVANGGRGLFIRVTDGATVTLDRGSPLCGYAEGEMLRVPDEAGGKTVAFHLRSPDASVFFEGQLRSVRELLDTSDVDSVVGHVAVRDSESGELTGLQLLDDQQQFFVPRAEQPSPPSIMTLGQMANDLAVGGTPTDPSSGYLERSTQENALILVQRLERDPDAPSRLRPSRPISTLARTVTFGNVAPMELGCEYGGRYWRGQAR